MHIDIAAIVAWFVTYLPSIKGFTEWLKTDLDIVKLGKETFQKGVDANDEKDGKVAAERIRANADLLRSYTGIGVIELVVWLTKTLTYYIPLLIAFRYLLKVIEPRRESK